MRLPVRLEGKQRPGKIKGFFTSRKPGRTRVGLEDTQEVLPDLVPIYAGRDELVGYMRTATAKDHLDEAKLQLVYARIDRFLAYY